MGYRSDVALHIKGSEENFIKVQKEYFNKLENSQVKLWSERKSFNLREIHTFHETKESYVNAGKYLWNNLNFEPTDNNCMIGNLFWQDEKWLRYYFSQCDELLEILTANDYSWYYIHCGEDDEDVSIRNNEENIKEFHYEVFVPYILEHYYSRPNLRELPDQKIGNDK
jgi:hypothetical protein